MVRLALITMAVLPWVAACGSTSEVDDRFSKPNELMEQEIENRVSNIQYQHREELFNNLLWLKQAGEQAIPALLQGLKSPDAKTRSNCAWTLAQIGDRRVIPDLKRIANDRDPTVRLEVARTLVQLGDIKYCPTLIDSLDSDKVQVRYLCHEALKQATGRDFGYDHLEDNLIQRRQSILEWRTWWSDLSGDPWFAKSYAEKYGLAGDEGQPAMPPATPEVETKPIPPDGDESMLPFDPKLETTTESLPSSQPQTAPK